MSFKCNRCDKEADYIVDGESLCHDCKDNNKDSELQDSKTEGQKLAGV